jgi:superfamily II DNA or RNA helicase/5-methylcytosine-specific restriction endonuclease McrA
MSSASRSSFQYDLVTARQHASPKRPAAHQQEALTRLKTWQQGRAAVKGGILVLPTGGGKTFTATRFLTSMALSRGQKVLWLAHTHHLLDQAFGGFGAAQGEGYEVGHITGERARLTVRTVSGTVGHDKVRDIRATDDVVIMTLQTLVRAFEDGRLTGLNGFLDAAQHTGLTVVFDECHHAPATSYHRLITGLRAKVPNLHLLGLTATPTYTDDRRQGALLELFPQGILYQVDPQRLMAQGILARPHIEEAATQIEVGIDEGEYQAWVRTHRDLPEAVIAHLASNAQRNAVIADTYVRHRERYGQTIIFADRWFQCTALVQLLRGRGVRAEALFSHQDRDPGSAEARNARRQDENHGALERFRRGELDVLVNIRMLTEGTDVPNVQTVFLTRQTTSRILLTQMIGRALRGPKFGGTETAYIVAFIDQWKQHVNWARWDDLVVSDVEGGASASRERLPIQLVSTDLIEHLARALDTGQSQVVPFLTLLPLGWYAVSYDVALGSEPGPAPAGADLSDDVETVTRLVPVYDQDWMGYQELFKEAERFVTPKHSPFGELSLSVAAANTVQIWIETRFTSGERLTRLDQDVTEILRHWAQVKKPPVFTPFEARTAHDLDALAQRLAFVEQLGVVQLDQALRREYSTEGRLWPLLYPTYALFKQQADASVNQLLRQSQPVGALPEAGQAEERSDDPEVSDEIKRMVRARDGARCLCCGSTTRLQIDHIQPRYLGGSHHPDNLQMLCAVCNRLKGIQEWNFRVTESPVQGALPELALPRFIGQSNNPEDLERYVRRVVNLSLRAGVVQSVAIGLRGEAGRHWEVTLHAGNATRELNKRLEQVQTYLNSLRTAERRFEIESIRAVKGSR